MFCLVFCVNAHLQTTADSYTFIFKHLHTKTQRLTFRPCKRIGTFPILPLLDLFQTCPMALLGRRSSFYTGCPCKTSDRTNCSTNPLSHPPETSSKMAEVLAPAEISPSLEVMGTGPSFMTLTSPSASAVQNGTPPSTQPKNPVSVVEVLGDFSADWV